MLNCKRSNIYLIFSLDSNKSEQSLTVSRFLKLNRHKTFTLHRFLGIPCIYRGVQRMNGANLPFSPIHSKGI